MFAGQVRVLQVTAADEQPRPDCLLGPEHGRELCTAQ